MFGDKMQRNIEQDPADPIDHDVMQKYNEAVSEIAQHNKGRLDTVCIDVLLTKNNYV